MQKTLTLEQLRKIFRDNNIEYVISEIDGQLVKINVWVDEINNQFDEKTLDLFDS